MKRSEQKLIVRLWKDWCRVWPEQYGHESLRVHPDGYDPVFDVIPSQAYRDFYFEVAVHHPKLRHLNAFELIDIALNQVQAPEASRLLEDDEAVLDSADADSDDRADLPEPTVVEVELTEVGLENAPRRVDSA